MRASSRQGALPSHNGSTPDKTPWDDDIACARQAFEYLETGEVTLQLLRDGKRKSNQYPDQWWRINSHEEAHLFGINLTNK